MAFGLFKERGKGPHEVSCPLCKHRQTESPLAVSSLCKGCGAYLKFDGGKVTAKPKEAENPFADRPPQPELEKAPTSPTVAKTAKPKPPEVSPASSKPPAQPILPKTSKVAEVAKTPQAPKKPAPAKAPPKPPAEDLPETSAPSRFTATPPEDAPPPPKNAGDQRLAVCFECGDSHMANARANSTQCRKCGRLISLENFEIKTAMSSRIQTRGDVFIYKKGKVIGTMIQCHNLTVEGSFDGGVECSGTITLRRHARIMGKVTCDKLRIERRAKVEFDHTIETKECLIDGNVVADITCPGLLALEKRATLQGDIKVGRLSVAEGAKHSGQIQMGGF